MSGVSSKALKELLRPGISAHFKPGPPHPFFKRTGVEDDAGLHEVDAEDARHVGLVVDERGAALAVHLAGACGGQRGIWVRRVSAGLAEPKLVLVNGTQAA